MDIINIFLIQFWYMVVGHLITSYYILLEYSFIWSDLQKDEDATQNWRRSFKYSQNSKGPIWLIHFA